MSTHRPPALARRILEWALPPGAKSDAVVGDLHEEFLARRARGALAARIWYAREALSVAARYLWARGTGRLSAGTTNDVGNQRRPLMDTIVSNLKYSLRRLTKSPFFTLVAIVSLGLGIGANTAMFSVVNSVILQDLPYAEPEELVDVYYSSPGFSHGTLSYPDWQDLREASGDVFEDVGGTQLTLVQVDTEDGGVEGLIGEAVTGNFFGLLGLDAAVGRLLTEEDHVAPGAHPVVVLGHGFWQRRYGGDPGVVGETMRVAGQPYTIIGVMEPDFQGSLRSIVPDVYVPILQFEEIQPGLDIFEERNNHSFFAKARLRDGATMVEARGLLGRLDGDLQERFPEAWQPGNEFVLVPTADVIMNPMIDRVMLPAAAMMMVVVGLVLLIACANLASFLLARASDRRKEIAVRLAMGAGRRTLVGQLLTETVVLSLLGGAAGVGMAVWSLDLLAAADLPLPLPFNVDFAVDGTVLGFSLGLSLLAGLLFGLAPALQSTNPDVAPVLRDETAGAGGARGGWLRDLLVTGQVAVSVVLLVASGLFLRSLDESRKIDPGFGTKPAGLLEMVLPVDRYSEAEALAYLDQVKERVAALPGVGDVGLITNLHLNSLSTNFTHVRVDGVEPPPGEDFHRVDYGAMDEGFFQAADIEMLSGRGFTEADTPDGQRVVVVNEAFARRFFPGQDPVGQTIMVQEDEVQIVGVAATAKIRYLGEEPRPFVYDNFGQNFRPFLTLVASTGLDPAATATRMMEEARALDPQVMVVSAKSMERHLAVMLLPREAGALAVSGFALLALILASVGLYGVVSYAVSRRVREVGIRISMGAEPDAVVRMLTLGGMRLVAVGGVVGLGVAALLAQLLSRLLYGVPALDPVTFVGVPLVLGAVALLASWVPARRASRVDPVTALRSE